MAKIFISHASDDQETVAVPLADRLRQRGLEVWLDQWELTVGDRLRETVENALSKASFGVVIVSPAYMRKLWATRELDGLFRRETFDRKLILPILHNLSQDEVSQRWPMLGDRLSCSTDRGLDVVADQILLAVQRQNALEPATQPPDAVLAEYRRRMLLAADGRDLRQLLYELEDFLRHFPAHPAARLLKDEIEAGLQYEELKYHRYERAPSWRYRRPLWPVLLVGGILYLLYLIAKFVLGL